MDPETVSLKEFVAAELGSLRRHIDVRIDAVMERAEAGDRQTAQSITLLGTSVRGNTESIGRIEENQRDMGRRVRLLEDKQLASSTTAKVLLALVGILGVGNVLALVDRIAQGG